ncbi:3-oxoacyl-[acyl-carrier protein] reductase [Erythromicrobium ramosum]|uniref:3-oxoacyl-[acyl-carrier protein] reductase n=1 Tax=Erythrobacter ramosus TaxID=35811 RepID=A0A6I4ULT9_9SPHN|nr:SDR family oxidoreductase [Erythrobacter ramosus]MBB3777048.1 3-oxoacyl-[acyl-carrier protein] reductase [Erythrobacter ramosus]MXP39812.1 SDR family oxidoreductase [Erythrobacter ramosus]
MTDPLDFTGKRVLVIGGSSGIGNGIAHGFRGRGASVTVTGTRPDFGDYLEAEDADFTGLDYRQLDLTDRDAADRLAAELGPVHVLVLSQGTVRYGRQEFTRAGWDAVVDINLNSVMDAARAFHPALATAKGAIIIISSVAAFKSTIGTPAYAASKAGAASLTKTLGEAWARDGIRVNGIAPGLVPTKLTSVTTDNPERLEASLKAIPLRRMGTPEDMAGAALFLASPLSAYITGQTLVVDGGLTLG